MSTVSRKRISWRVQIIGNDALLQELTKLFTSPVQAIIKEPDGYFLTGSELDGLNTHQEVRQKAEEFVQLISASIKLLSATGGELLPAHVFELLDDGTKMAFLDFAEGLAVSAEVTLEITDPAGTKTVIKATDILPKWIAAARGDEAVARVLRLSGRPMDWVNLYKIFEAINHDVDTVKQGWTTDKKRRLFKQTANSVGALGDDARHGKEDTEPPKDPMSYGEAKSFVETLTHEYMRFKTA